jgi:phospholipase/carboxylesterase
VTVSRRAADGLLASRPGPPSGSPLPPGRHQLDVGSGVTAEVLVPRAEIGPLPLLVFCHGAGGNADGALNQVGGQASDAGVLVLATTSVRSTWDLIAGGLGRDVAVLDAALAAVFARAAVSRTAVGGFSDGASYALSLGLANGELFDAVLAFSPGFAAPPGRQGRPRVRISHGTRDRVLPVERCGRRVAEVLGQEGYAVTYEEFPDGHVVPPTQVSSALAWWLGEPPG